jgi:putative FmdB family regulatory protein
MPIREFLCPKCKVITERLIFNGEEVYAECFKCGKELKDTIISSCTFELKGGGWYADGYSNKKE